MAKLFKAYIFNLVVVFFILHPENAWAASKKNVRIVGGTTTNIANVPYLMQLRVNGRFTCGASLVSPKYVVTAAHCLLGVAIDSIVVKGGVSKLTGKGVQRKVSKIYRNSRFSLSTFDMDVAVLELQSKMSGNNIKTIDLCSTDLKIGQQMQVSGWGTTSSSSSSVSNQLRTVNVPILSTVLCAIKYRNDFSLSNTMMCGSVSGAKDACQGDSGGPGVINGELCGIVSWGIGCASKNYPGVYTNVNRVKKWIRKVMGRKVMGRVVIR